MTVVVSWVVQASALRALAGPFHASLAALCAASHFVRMLGITLGFHRHLAHRSFRTGRANRFFWALLGTAASLEDRVEICLQDYRDLSGSFDKIVSIEMFEALGQENWPTFFRKCEDVLAPDGLIAIQAISIPDHRFDEYLQLVLTRDMNRSLPGIPAAASRAA